MLYKEGARRKALQVRRSAVQRLSAIGHAPDRRSLRRVCASCQLRLWVMDGAKVSYYKLGESTPKGAFHVHM